MLCSYGKNDSLSGLGYQGFLAPLVVHYAVVVDLLHVVTVKEDAFGALEICGGTYSEVWQAKPRVTMATDQIRLYVVPRRGS